MQTHKRVRAVVEEAMQRGGAAGGFNVQLVSALADYGAIPPDSSPIALDWSPGNTTVLYGQVATGDLRLTRLHGRLTLAIAPGGSQFTGETKGVRWSGELDTMLIFRLRYSIREGDDEIPEEDVAAAVACAIHDATIETFQSFRGWPTDVIYSRPPDCPDGFVDNETDDGLEILIPMRVGLKVDATN